MKTFLSWAGGKCRNVHHLKTFVPGDLSERIYREPFVGGGSLYFALNPPKAFISDLNHHLINFYKMVKEKPLLIHTYLQRIINKNTAETYYIIREKYNVNSADSAKQAARFLYLNKTSFNGIFRVNTKGKFNVPYGKKDNPNFPTKDELVKISNCLKPTVIFQSSYEKALNKAKIGDFIYMDPPYPPLNGTSYFTHYTKERFAECEQIKVAETARRLNSLKCLVMISNADIPLIRNLYKDWRINSLPVTRWITCKSIKHKVNELVITNY